MPGTLDSLFIMFPNLKGGGGGGGLTEFSSKGGGALTLEQFVLQINKILGSRSPGHLLWICRAHAGLFPDPLDPLVLVLRMYMFSCSIANDCIFSKVS